MVEILSYQRGGVAGRAVRLGRWLVVFLAIGAALRIVRYGLGLPLWADEALLGTNLLDRGFHELMRPMENIQVAPIGFLWIERAMYQMFGMSEYVMRLVPALAGLAALFVFAYWACLVAEPLAATIATAVLAVSDLCVRHTAELKPYGIDLLMSLLLLVAATQYLLRRRDRWQVALIVLAPPALFVSFPAIFVAAGVAITLLAAGRRIPARGRVLTVIYALVLAATFCFLFFRVTASQYSGVVKGQLPLWKWPPHDPWKFIVWFYRSHTGNFFGYPLDASGGWSIGSFALFVIGAIHWFKRRRGALLGLLLIPFALTFAAAVAHRYPYGASSRVEQHLVPAMCLLIGVGTATLIESLARTREHRRVTTHVVFGILAVIAAIGLASVLLFPSRDVRINRQARHFIVEMLSQAGGQRTIAVLQSPHDTPSMLRWYMHEPGHRVVWSAWPDFVRQHAPESLWVLNMTNWQGVGREVAAAMGRPAELSRHENFGGDAGRCDLFEFATVPVPGR